MSFSLTGRKVTSDGTTDAAEEDGFSAMGKFHEEKGCEYHMKNGGTRYPSLGLSYVLHNPREQPPVWRLQQGGLSKKISTELYNLDYKTLVIQDTRANLSNYLDANTGRCLDTEYTTCLTRREADDTSKRVKNPLSGPFKYLAASKYRDGVVVLRLFGEPISLESL